MLFGIIMLCIHIHVILYLIALKILGAAYGPRDVTAILNSRISQHQSLSIQASNGIFGDPWGGVFKSLVAVYEHDGYSPAVAIVHEGQTLHIPSRPELPRRSELRIVGAAYGLADVTGKVRSLVNYEHLDVVASNGVFGDFWYGVPKTLVVVYQYGEGPYRTRTATENNRLVI